MFGVSVDGVHNKRKRKSEKEGRKKKKKTKKENGSISRIISR